MKILQALSGTCAATYKLFEGSLFFNFFQYPKKFGDMVVNNLMHVPIDRRESKTKIKGQISNLELENCGFSTSDTILSLKRSWA